MRTKMMPKKVYRIASKSTNAIHEVKVFDNGKVWCPCIHYRYRGWCQHTIDLGLVKDPRQKQFSLAFN